jgi:hypothetical protein
MAVVISVPKFIGLLQQANKAGALYASIVGANCLALGADPMNPDLSIDISRETIEPLKNGNAVKKKQAESAESKIQRRIGHYSIEVLGTIHECTTCREILKAGLLAIEKARPGTFEKLSHVKPKSRRIVARDPEMLFDNKALVKDYSAKLTDGWWYGTNNSAQETIRWLERACSHAGLTWGKDVRTNLVVTIDDLF